VVQSLSYGSSAQIAPYGNAHSLFPSKKRPTLGAHPDKSEGFHCTRIHTILDKRLDNFENYHTVHPLLEVSK
ncbi:MAG: hypothetical protein ACKVKP_14700, partial [Acidimicrobiales bacterium]